MNKPFFDEETVEKVREHDKEEIVLNRKKQNFNKITTAMDSYNDYNYNNEALLMSYIGPKYKYFVTRKFNWSAFFFGAIYMLYRKMYIYGLLLTVFLSIVNNYFVKIGEKASILVLVFDLILYLIIGLSFNGMYVGSCINDINRLKQEYPTLDTNELCKKKGGTSLIIAIIVSIIINIAIAWIMKKI